MGDLPFWPDLPYWPALVFWGGIVVGMMAAGLGTAQRRASLLMVGAVLVLPASLYLTATPRLRFVGFVPVLCLLLAAHAVRRNRVWLGGLLVAAGVLFWSVVASMVGLPILLHVLAAGAAIGLVVPRRAGWQVAVYVPIGIVGAFVGALLSFGDDPVLMRYPYLNPWTLSVLTALVFVTVLQLAEKRIFGRARGREP